MLSSKPLEATILLGVDAVLLLEPHLVLGGHDQQHLDVPMIALIDQLAQHDVDELARQPQTGTVHEPFEHHAVGPHPI